MRTQSTRIAELDGLRAVAIALVVAYHFDLYVRGGFVGVDLFFAISGLVITRALLGQLARTDAAGELISGRKLLADFYLRRTWRLLPSLVVMLAVVVALAKLFPGPDFRYTVDNAIASLSGFANWWVGSTATTQVTVALVHTWSLAIEEQFYLVLPIALIFSRPFSERIAVLLSGVLIGASVWVVATMTFDEAGYNRVYFSSFARATPVALGVVLGVWCHRRELARLPAHRVPPFVNRHRLMVVCRALLMVALLPVLVTANFSSHWLYRGGFQVVGLIMAAIVALSVVVSGSNDVSSRLLRSRLALLIGDRSYSLYLVHFPLVFRFDSFGRVGGLAMKVVVTLVATELLYRYVETPLRRKGPQLARGRLLVVVQAMVALLSIGYLVKFS